MSYDAGLAVRCEDLGHVYRVGGTDVVALDGVDLSVAPGDVVAVLGPSGCGKSTLMSLVGGLQRPSAGRVLVGRDDVGAMTVRELLTLRAGSIGVIAQNPSRGLLAYATAEDNISFARRGSSAARSRDLPAPAELMRDLGLEHLSGTPVHRLSGGEQQRVAVAVALATSPGLVLADEPTSQLDNANRDAVVALLLESSARSGTTVVMVTHDEEVAAAARRSVVMHAGRVVSGSADDPETVVVGDDGTVSLPPSVHDVLPPGTQAQVVPTPDGVRLVRRR